MKLNISVVKHPDVVAAMTPYWFHYISGVLLLLSSLTSLFLNGSIVYVFGVKFRNKLNRMKYYILSISVLSIFMSAFSTPLVIISSFEKIWIFQEFGCMYYGFVVTFCGLTKTVILLLICIDRFIYVVLNSFTNNLMAGFSNTLMAIAIFLSLSFAIRPLFGWNQYVFVGVGTACAIDVSETKTNGRSFVISLLIGFFALPVFVMILSYVSVIIKVKRDMNHILNSDHIQSEASQMITKLQGEKRLIIALSLTIGFFLFCWTPYAVILFWSLYHEDVLGDPMLKALPEIFAKVGSVFTPFIYVLLNKKFRQTFLSIFHCVKSNSVIPEERWRNQSVYNSTV